MATEENEALKEAIGKRIKQLRLEANYTSYETFAIENGFARKNYWRMEKGKNFTIDTLLRLVNIHNITLEEFFKGVK
jgi:transcriptional regulator with XRE-family HTH domain